MCVFRNIWRNFNIIFPCISFLLNIDLLFYIQVIKKKGKKKNNTMIITIDGKYKEHFEKKISLSFQNSLQNLCE